MLRLRRPETPTINIPLTSLIDIVFLLLVYFLLTSNFIEQDSIDVSLPEATSIPAGDQDQLVITIDRQGSCYLGGVRISEESLASELAVRLRSDPLRGVLVKADRRVVYDRVVRVMDLARRQGVRKLLLAIDPK